jgi:hypothetical protein
MKQQFSSSAVNLPSKNKGEGVFEKMKRWFTDNF